jgi:hypothetical protein
LRKKLVKCYILSIGLLGAECWSLWKARNNSDILKCGAEEGWRRSVEMILCAMTKYCIEMRKRGITYK